MKVIIYTTPYCAPCTQTKKYLTYLKVDYTAVDISDNQELRHDIFTKAHAVTVPIIQYGKEYVVGYKPAEIKRLLGL